MTAVPTRNTSMTYDPFQHADELGLQVEYQRLRSALGLYIHDEHRIILRTGLRARTERSVLAHEIAHHLHNDVPVESFWTPRQERRADRTAAQMLINPKRLHQAQQASPDPGRWAAELDITGDILLAYLNTA